MAEDSSHKNNKGDDQSAAIIALLKDVGKRLRDNEQERIEMREIMEDFENRFDQSENVFLSVHDRLSKTETQFTKRQDAIEAAQIEQAARIEKAAAMADKIEEAMAQHAKINRRLDQAAQDKVRIIRQLEKIEDTVIETQTALRETAMVPVGKYEKRGLPKGDDKPLLPPFMKKTSVRVAGVAAMILLGVIGGWAMNGASTDALMSAFNDDASAVSYQAAKREDPSESRFVTAANRQIETSVFDRSARKAGLSPQKDIQQYEQGFSSEKILADASQKKSTKSPLEMSNEELVLGIENDHNALAAQLNKIEPANGHAIPEDMGQIAEDHAPLQGNKADVAFVAPQKIKMQSVEDFISSQKAVGAIRERIAPDTALPSVIKEVENQAYKGIAEAQHDLAAIYTAGHGGVPVDFERAAQWFKESAINGVANARYNLGVLYHQGLGVDQDINTAVNWYRAAAELGHPEAQYNLGIAYIEGIGTNYSPARAAHYFEQAANGGVLEAAYNLGLIHENGLTGNAQPNEALFWYKYAADLGSTEAEAALDQLSETLGLFPADIERIYDEHPKPQKTGASNVAREVNETDSRNTDTITAGTLNPADASDISGETTVGAALEEDFSLDRHVPNLAPSAGQEEFKSRVAAVDSATVAQLQEQLMRLGLYPGPPDGIYNSITEDAIRAYQAEFALTPDGRPTQALLVHMMTSDFDNREYGSRE